MSDSLLDKIKALIASEETTEPPADKPEDGDKPPAWAQQLIDRLDALESTSPSGAAGGDKPESGGGASPPAPVAAAGKDKESPSTTPAGAAPPAGAAGGRGPWTDERLEAMTPEQINKNWDSIEAQWKSESR